MKISYLQSVRSSAGWSEYPDQQTPERHPVDFQDQILRIMTCWSFRIQNEGILCSGQRCIAIPMINYHPLCKCYFEARANRSMYTLSKWNLQKLIYLEYKKWKISDWERSIVSKFRPPVVTRMRIREPQRLSIS
jgi:hypothetical protein